MATDATGTPTAKGIPKYNPDVDAPSGLGFNAAMDTIDALFDKAQYVPSGSPSARQVAVWNGSSWTYDKVRPQDLQQDGATTGQALIWDGSKWAPGSVGGSTLVTSLPGSPTDGQEIVLVDSLTAPTYSWHLRYVAAKASNKWIFVGGAPGFGQVDTDESTTSTTYAALATAGPSFTLPVPGDYIVEVGCSAKHSAAAEIFMSYDIGATGAVDADAYREQDTNSTIYSTGSYARKKTGLAAVALVAKYRGGAAGTANFRSRWMRVTPIAIGG